MLINIPDRARPVDQADRISAIDTLRGIALLGILLMNIPYFALPERFSDTFHQDLASPDFWTDVIIVILFEGKMRALFSMIFGAGILLFILRKKRTGQPYKVLFFRRMGWLVLFGIMHAHLLLWTGDILYYYGIIGMIAFLFRNWRPRYLILGIPLVAVMSFILSTLFYHQMRSKRLDYLKVAAIEKQHRPLTAKQKKTVEEWNKVQKEFIPNQQQIDDHTRSMKSDYQGVAKYIRPVTWDAQTKYLYFVIGDILALMMLGMALYKWKFFTNGWPLKNYVYTVIIGYGIGLPLVIYNYYYAFKIPPGSEALLHYMETHPVQWNNLIYPFQRILLVMAHASLIMLILRAGLWRNLTRRLAAVGQMAFTNYIMQTVLCTLFFFGYGLDYYAEIEFYELYFFVAAIWIIQLFISPIWLKSYLFGPLEWIWRSLTYLQIQPFKRS